MAPAPPLKWFSPELLPLCLPRHWPEVGLDSSWDERDSKEGEELDTSLRW